MTPDDMVRAADALIEARKTKGARLFVAIDGGAGAGKSTLARGIQELRGAVSILRTDHFFRPLNEHPIGSLAGEKLYELYFEWQRMRDEAFIPLRRGETANYQSYDWSADKLLQWETVEPAGIVLVEGVYSSRPELRSMLDAMIFVDAPREERLRRIKARNPNESSNWLIPWLKAENYYLNQIRPQSTADLLLASAE